MDPAAVLFADEAGEPAASCRRENAFGFYWTEGLRGLGWAQDAVPTLKGGSTVGIPSPPGSGFRTPSWGVGLCGPQFIMLSSCRVFPKGWTDVELPLSAARAMGARWKMLGNAVTVGVSEWVGARLRSPGGNTLVCERLAAGRKWPPAAFGSNGEVYAVEASMWPQQEPLGSSLERRPAVRGRATLVARNIWLL